jgi:hypothetical protein
MKYWNFGFFFCVFFCLCEFDDASRTTFSSTTPSLVTFLCLAKKWGLSLELDGWL